MFDISTRMRVPMRDGQRMPAVDGGKLVGRSQAIRSMSDTLNPNLPEDVQNDDDLDFAAIGQLYDQAEVRDGGLSPGTVLKIEKTGC